MKKIIGTACLLGVASAAQAGMSFNPGVISMTYADPAAEQSVVHTTGGMGDSSSTVTVNTNVVLEFDLSGIGGGTEVFANTRIDKVVSVGTVNEVSPGVFIADAFDGMFTFTDTKGTADVSDDEVILTGNYGTTAGSSGAVFILSESGNLTANDSFVGGSLELGIGPALASILGPGFTVGDDRDASWTLTNITPDASVNEFGFFNDFFADGAFTGSFNVVPNPGSVALAGIGGLMLIRSRKRA